MRISLCSDDPVVSVLSQTLKANVVRIPEERLAPLWVLARRDNALDRQTKRIATHG